MLKNWNNDIFFPCVIFKIERARLAKEKQLREEAQRDREEMRQRIADMEEQVKSSQEALVIVFLDLVDNINQTKVKTRN